MAEAVLDYVSWLVDGDQGRLDRHKRVTVHILAAVAEHPSTHARMIARPILLRPWLPSDDA
jgi:hypothetical protein